MRIGIPDDGGPLVPATPATTARLVGLGYDVVVAAGAGSGAGFPDAAYQAAGAAVVPDAEAWSADVVAITRAPDALATPGPAGLRPGARGPDGLRIGAVLIAQIAPAARPDLVRALANRGVTALALDAVPRISRAQSLDVLSALSNVAGYRAVVEAAAEFGGMFSGQVTAAGTTPPANVFVIGAGVAGLAAIGAAGSLGAQVRAFDVRPEAAEQIESMGATVVRADDAAQQVSADGYASALTADQEAAALRAYAVEAAAADIVITTALVRGTAPTTITAEMVATMRPGSVIVDLAAPGGGNCELTVPGRRVVSDNGVVILGWTDLPDRMPRHTSELLGTAVANLVQLGTPGRDGRLVLDPEDVVVRGMTVAAGGEVLWPPPPVAVSAPTAPGGPGSVAAPDRTAPGSRHARPAAGGARPASPMVRNGLLALGGLLAVLAVAASPAEQAAHFTVLALAVVVGFYVISHVSHALHTPLMSQTNAISGIILVGGMLQIGSSDPVVTTLAVLASTVASINIFGGFLVTHRMLGMFRRGDAAEGSNR
ncbi:Re/Si-specific NAD(P)(+) transhydrogenase subunit alpha [Promicromonospora iranensis]|uniref:proton-translocating NAD(P)(+) transhydrogenase n=1 Tax=Promicromonospora iranensis TaxID=1105144 RepID=A0ABU2CT95_9MICO|nr:Re/Si-specific NAD(P)(+) transhydrogenase subunit alpha [Promicromonospora iranensis]MDR7384551.1 NAD(P) transhydrogenase subunit alpha [Promicromonospora iranensis]